MGHDIDIIDIKTGKIISNTYITGNFSKYSKKYPGIYHIHGHKNNTVIKIIKKTLNLLLDDEIIPYLHDYYGDQNNIKKDLESYAASLQIFLKIAFLIKENTNNSDNIYWYSDQVSNIIKYKTDGYESDGYELNSIE